MIKLLFSSLALFPFMDPVSYPFTHQGETRSVHVYALAPSPLDSNRVPVVVALHGCLQSADDFSTLTRLKNWALRGQGILVSPEQSPQYNGMKCWNWFQGTSQGQPPSEVGWLNAMLDHALKTFPYADPKRIQVWGLSAGATMAVTWAACSPDRFQQVVAHAGVAPFMAFDYKEAGQVMTQDPTPLALNAHLSYQCGRTHKAPLPALKIIHGDDDQVIHPGHGPHLLRHWLELTDWRDDDLLNQSLTWSITSSPRLPHPVQGAPHIIRGQCVRAHNTPQSCLAELWQIQALRHAWSGGLGGYPFSDAYGPDVTTTLLKSH